MHFHYELIQFMDGTTSILRVPIVAGCGDPYMPQVLDMRTGEWTSPAFIGIYTTLGEVRMDGPYIGSQVGMVANTTAATMSEAFIAAAYPFGPFGGGEEMDPEGLWPRDEFIPDPEPVPPWTDSPAASDFTSTSPVKRLLSLIRG